MASYLTNTDVIVLDNDSSAPKTNVKVHTCPLELVVLVMMITKKGLASGLSENVYNEHQKGCIL